MEPENTPPTSTKKMTISTPAAIVTAAVIIGIALIVVGGKRAPAPTAPLAPEPAGEVTSVDSAIVKIRADDRIRGNATADVVIFEYSDSDCSFCARFHPTLEQVVSEYGGKVAWVYRYFPLDSLHPNASTEAIAMECVAELGGNTAFNKYLDTIINVTLNADPKSNEALTTFATAQGINASSFKSCLASTTASDRVKKDALEAEAIGARGTPFSIAVNMKTGKQAIIPGAYPLEDVKKMIDGLLK